MEYVHIVEYGNYDGICYPVIVFGSHEAALEFMETFYPDYQQCDTRLDEWRNQDKVVRIKKFPVWRYSPAIE